jgi:hypothetical protein
VVKAAYSVITAFPTAQRPSLNLAKRNLASMLPGFRFLFAAIVLTMSVLVFGFGAAALLRTAHEEFASTPSWQPAPETRFAQNHPAAQPGSPPVLAMLRVDDPPKETPQATPKEALKADQPASDAAPATAPADQAATTATEPQSAPENISALPAADSSPQETTKESAQPEAAMPEAPVAESPPQAATDAPATADPTTQQPTNEAAPAPAVEIAQASPEQASPEHTVPEHTAPEAAPEPARAPVPAALNSISTRIATLGGPPVTIEPSKTKPDSANSDDSAVKKRQRARREVRRRRIVVRRLVRQTTQLDPFGQPVAATTR